MKSLIRLFTAFLIVMPLSVLPVGCDGGGGVDYCGQIQRKATECNVPPPWGSGECPQPQTDEDRAEAACMVDCANAATCAEAEMAAYEGSGPVIACFNGCLSG